MRALIINWLVSKTKAYKDLLARHERLCQDFEDVINKRATLKDIAERNGTITVEAATESAALLATQFLHWLDELKAENYLETVFKESLRNAAKHDREPIEVIVTVQRKNGKTPHQIRKELEAELEQLKK
jgi:uncharacterized protein YceH (UPF0502 family)